MRRRALPSLIALILFAAGCPKKEPPKRAIECFSATATDTSAGTRAVFEARRCQGGGVTWAAILTALARRHGRVAAVDEPTPGWGGSVYTLDGKARFSVDDEADAALFCADDPALLATMKRDYAHVNGDANALRAVMAEAPADEMECFEADGRAPKLPAMLPMPQPPASDQAAVRAATDKLARAIREHTAFCFLPRDAIKQPGLLHFTADGRLTLTANDGKLVSGGRWTAPLPALGDPRIEVILDDVGGGVFHFYADELTPGPCPRARK